MNNANITVNGYSFSCENNGDCYITDDKPYDFPNTPFSVIITADEPMNNRVYQNAELIEPYSIDGRYWFAFRELTPDELYRRQLDDERDMTLELIADQEYRLCLIDLGLN